MCFKTRGTRYFSKCQRLRNVFICDDEFRDVSSLNIANILIDKVIAGSRCDFDFAGGEEAIFRLDRFCEKHKMRFAHSGYLSGCAVLPRPGGEAGSSKGKHAGSGSVHFRPRLEHEYSPERNSKYRLLWSYHKEACS
jgi:hypothetical protein